MSPGYAFETFSWFSGKRRLISSWQETNLDTGHTTDHGNSDYDYEMSGVMSPNHYGQSNMETPLYVDTRGGGNDVMSPMTSEEMQNSGFGEDLFILSLF